MKFKHSIIFMALLAITSMFASCSEGEYWDEYIEETEKYSFETASSSFSLNAADVVPSTYVIKVVRNNAGGSVTLPVTGEFSSIFSGVESVTFEEGQSTAEYAITVNADAIVMGTTYTAKIAFDAEKASVSGISTYTLSLKKDYTWVSAGKCIMASNWAGAQANVPIEKAAEYSVGGNHLYRLVSPYYYLEPSYCPKPGFHVQFYLDSNYEPLTLPRTQDVGEKASGGGNYHLFYFEDGSYNCAFTRSGDVFTIKAVWAYGPVDGGYSLHSYATEMFKWTEGCPVE